MIPVTILISTSPIPSNPSTRIILETIAAIKVSLPDAPIIVMADGTSSRVSPMRMVAYSGFKDALKYEGHGLLTVQEHYEHVNQAGMLGRALAEVKTPLLLYLEHDWVTSPNVEWEKLGALILNGTFNVIRLYAYCRVHPLHEGMCFERVIHNGVPFIHTSQWSQNPHLASTEFYRQLLPKYIEGHKDAIENCLHGPCACGPWEDWKVAIYNPIDEGSMMMVRHIDGREGER